MEVTVENKPDNYNQQEMGTMAVLSNMKFDLTPATFTNQLLGEIKILY